MRKKLYSFELARLSGEAGNNRKNVLILSHFLVVCPDKFKHVSAVSSIVCTNILDNNLHAPKVPSIHV